MGKKSKKKGGGSNSGKKKAGTVNNTNAVPRPVNPKRDADQQSLYKIYKYCTEAVIQWGRGATKKKTKGKTNNHHRSSLSHAIFDILQTLASDGVLMPENVSCDLALAISYRKRVGQMYRSLVPHLVTEDDYARHEWVIQQLEKLQKAFRNNSSKNREKESDDSVDGLTQKRAGFEALAALSDEEESVASLEDEESNNGNPHRFTIVLDKPPTPEELKEEERLFAISLLMCEVESIRDSLKARWKKWAEKSPSSDEAAGKDLLAITACTEYALSAVRKTTLQVSMETDHFHNVDEILGVSSKTENKGTQLSNNSSEIFQEKNLVTLHALEKRPDLNGRHGIVIGEIEGGRQSVQLFPRDAYASPDPKQQLSIKPENLLLSDNTYRRLRQIHAALSNVSLDKTDIPSPPARIYGAPTSSEVQKQGIAIIMTGDQIEKAAQNQDFEALLQLTIQLVLPTWLSMARYLPDVGAADAVLVAYLRDYSKSRKILFPLVFALLITIDSTMASFRYGSRDSTAEKAKELFVDTIRGLFANATYTPPIRLFEAMKKKADALYSHLEFTRHMCDEYSMAGLYFPLVSGELFLSGLRMHFVCGSGFPYAFVDVYYTHVLHVYWLLRSEGYLGKIPDLEAVVGMYRQNVFFRGGLAKKGQEAYLKNQQLAQGVSVQEMRVLSGKAVAKKTGKARFDEKALGRDGLHVSEISRLLDILQWKSMPIVDKETCFNAIETIAQEEFSKIFTAPLLQVSCKVVQMGDLLAAGFFQRAQLSGPRMIDRFALHTSGMTPVDLVSFWAMCLGDDRSVVPGEKQECLSALADQFTRVFVTVEPTASDEEPTLQFSPNEHTVDSSLWGEKGVRKVEHLQV